MRIVKTAIATLLAILIAEFTGVDGALSAGLLAILGVDVTRKRSLVTISARFFASILGLVLAFILFYVLGFHIWVLAIYILIAFPLIAKARFKEGIVTSSVVVFRVFGGEEVSWHVMLSQVELLIIGLGSALLVNFLYMPKPEEKLMEIRRQVDGRFSVIFRQIAASLRDPYHLWDGKELTEAAKLVDEGLSAARRAVENQMIFPNEAWTVYFYMRKQQLDRIEGMLELISQVYQRMPQGEIAALLFDRLSIDVSQEEYTGITERMLAELEQQFKTMELPSTREEFEIRSAILQLCRELSLYLEVSKKSKAPLPLKAAGRKKTLLGR
ncbi:aromatic acid exporter family protein [Paenibacillus macerans]|uniref:Aromatic acid exporter family protein n=1 Tax=Paenibacillus macerans TaxID=44252 RepID=A0A6N8F162_PAEMA|nr:aromatic acid exporter family protein [Paenibacillus macerans]MED4959138.1 aromatic acid exporter family protein [Paenibacillus macerans]MUG24643.1 aromatic acid exporter family protein [Paenibacillus macerans]